VKTGVAHDVCPEAPVPPDTAHCINPRLYPLVPSVPKRAFIVRLLCESGALLALRAGIRNLPHRPSAIVARVTRV